MSAPLISVIMGVYNTAPYLAEAIESVLGQTYAPIELVVIDDGSDDGSGEIARGFGDAIVYAYQENAGNGAARNHAARLATGDLFAFLDADDRFVPDKLTRQWQALSRAPELDMVFGHMSEFVSPEVSEEERRALRPPAPVPTPWTGASAMLIKREPFFRVGPFSETLKVAVTVDWYARADDAGLRRLMLPGVVLERRLHAQNNGIRERDSRFQYIHVLKAAIDRRRANNAGDAGSDAEES